ncbi:MAG: hypothetical protein LBC53_00110 [Spirochaetaceae bacterium]|jgi:hypothetical protein|nr:hypothetical protein [Spirochaetaceae bacterium]
MRSVLQDLGDNQPGWRTSPMFKLDSVDEYKNPKLWQIWRDHLLSISMIKKYNEFGEYDDGYFIYLYPSQNTECRDGINKYKNYLNNTHNVLEIYLEDIIAKIRMNIEDDWTKELSDWANELSERYIGK